MKMLIGIALVFPFLVIACVPIPAATPMATPTVTTVAFAAPTATTPPTATTTPTQTATATDKNTPTETTTAASTASDIATATLTRTPTNTPLPTKTATSRSVTLRDLADKDGVEIGTLIEWWRATPKYLDVLRNNYNHLLIGTVFEWQYMVHSAPNKLDFQNIDKALNFAEQNNLTADASSITWGSRGSLPDWLKQGSFSKDELAKLLRDHIATVMGRYKGRFERVVVVNEPWGSPWESSFWTDKLATDYIVQSFRAARAADPTTKLAINDFSIEFAGDPKAERMFELVKSLNEAEQQMSGERLIDAVGFQMPLLLLNGVPEQNMNVNDFVDPHARAVKMEQLRENIRRYKAIGVEVFVSEAFVDLTDVPGTMSEKSSIQADIYSDLLRVCLEEGVSFTTYGFHDDIAAYPEAVGRPNAYPFIFDEQYNAKPAYYAVRDVLMQYAQKQK